MGSKKRKPQHHAHNKSISITIKYKDGMIDVISRNATWEGALAMLDGARDAIINNIAQTTGEVPEGDPRAD